MNYNIYVGIDPSINSTGLYVNVSDINDNLIEEQFCIIKPEPLKKKETAAEEKYFNKFSFILYNKLEHHEEENYYEEELCKTKNFKEIVAKIKETIIYFDNKYNNNNNIYVCQEGISYGSSIRTKSVFDLAGLNYLLRNMWLDINANLLIVPPSEIKKYSTGKGNAKKEQILEVFDKIHDFKLLPKRDDIADAYFMGIYVKEKRELFD